MVRVVVNDTPWHPVGAEAESVTRPEMDSVALVLLALTVTGENV